MTTSCLAKWPFGCATEHDGMNVPLSSIRWIGQSPGAKHSKTHCTCLRPAISRAPKGYATPFRMASLRFTDHTLLRSALHVRTLQEGPGTTGADGRSDCASHQAPQLSQY